MSEKENKKNNAESEEYNALKEKALLADQYYDKLLRLQAETENIKKRLAKEKQDFVKFANTELISEFVNILDDFELAIDSAEKNHDAKLLLEGVKMITKHLKDVLKNQGLSIIDQTGVVFDHEKHEAVGSVESEEYEEDTVVEILRKGYMINGRVARPAIVRVSKKGGSTRQE
jgi:molecular chaperone GrpE